MAIVKKKTLDKILLDLNLTAGQVVEEGVLDSIRNFKNKFTNKKPVYPTPSYGKLTNTVGSSVNPARQPKPQPAPKAGAAATTPAPASPTQQKPAGDLKATTVQTIDQLKGLANSLEQQAAAMPTINTQQASRLYQQLTSFLVDGIKKAQSAMVPGTAGVGPRAENLPQAPEGITQPDGTQLPSSIAPQTNPGLAPQTAATVPTAATAQPNAATPEPLAGYQLPAGVTPGTQIPNLMSRVKGYMTAQKKTDMADEDFALLAKDLNTTPENLKTQYTQQVERNKTGTTVGSIAAPPLVAQNKVDKDGKTYTWVGQYWKGPDNKGIKLTDPLSQELTKLAKNPPPVAPNPNPVGGKIDLTASKNYSSYGPLSFLNE